MIKYVKYTKCNNLFKTRKTLECKCSECNVIFPVKKNGFVVWSPKNSDLAENVAFFWNELYNITDVLNQLLPRE